MLKAGVASTVIMKLTGHKTDAMFTRYTHLDEELGTDGSGRPVRFSVIGDLIAHAGLKPNHATVFKFGIELAFHTEQDVAF